MAQHGMHRYRTTDHAIRVLDLSMPPPSLLYVAVAVLGAAATGSHPGALSAGRAADSFALLQWELAVDRAEPAPRSGAGNTSAETTSSAPANTTAQAAVPPTNFSTAGNASSATNASTTAVKAPEEPQTNSNTRGKNSAAENETGWCGFQAQPGWVSAYTMPGTENLLLDLSEALRQNGSMQFMMTAMSFSGTYLDGKGFLTEFASPMEETIDTMFELRVGSDNISVDVHRPQMELRTSDSQLLAALQKGTGEGHIGTLGTYHCARRSAGGAFMSKASPKSSSVMNLVHQEQSLGEAVGEQEVLLTKSPDEREPNATAALASTAAARKLIISGGSLITKGFFVAPTVRKAVTYRLLSVKAYSKNLDVAVEYLMPDGNPLAVGFSMVQLPPHPMPSRPADDRLLYFTTDYRDLGEHRRYLDELPEESVDRKVSTIWRYNLASLPDQQIRIHIDPTVPKRWRKWFREGVEAWNKAYELIGKPKAVRAVLPEDEDWPTDYDISDARFSTISWTISESVVSMGIAKVDPRSGEILKSDIIMSDGWVRSWLGDLDLLAPNFTHQLDQSMGFRFEAYSDDAVILGRRRVPGRLRIAEDWGQKISLLSAAAGKPLKTSVQRDEVLGQGLRSVVTHETGHILGLRHNFKGSLGVTYSCIRSASCTAVRGLSASVMDYVPVNYPSAEAPNVHLFSPVLGEYDKLAIRYGYMEVPQAETEAMQESPAVAQARLAASLNEVLLNAESYDTCYDADRILKQDPYCTAYDMSSEPVRYYEDEIKRLAGVQLNLLNTSVMPGAPYTRYGDAVDTILMMAKSTGIRLAAWLGGSSNHYLTRRVDQTRVARQPVGVDAQRQALSLLLRIMRPEKAGLTPPEKHLEYLVTASRGSGSVESLDVAARVLSINRLLLGSALAPEVLQRLYAEEHLGTSSNGHHSGLSCGELLALVTQNIVGEGLRTSSRSEWNLHRLLVESLAEAYQTSTLAGAVHAQVMHHLVRLHGEVVTAQAQQALQADTIEDETSWGPGEQALTQAHLLSLQQDIRRAICSSNDDVAACGLLSSSTGPRIRRGLVPLAATLFAAAAVSV